MMKYNLFIIFALCTLTVYPVSSINRWFSASYQDLRMTLRRYGHCVGDLSPIKDRSFNETDFLVHQIKLFLDIANYDNEQLSNVSALMDNICRINASKSDQEQDAYPISVNIDVAKYNHEKYGKANRCKAIDESMDEMYRVFKRAALNKSEPLDFSVIQFIPNPANKDEYYNLTDLINTSWIKADVLVEQVCKITDSVKEYVQNKTSNSTAQDRSQSQASGGIFMSILNYIDSILEPLLGLQKRLFLEGNNRLEIVYHGISNRLGELRDGFGSRLKSTRDRVSSLFISSSNSTLSSNFTLNHNSTGSHNSTVSSIPSVFPNNSSWAQNSTIVKKLVDQPVNLKNPAVRR